MEVFREVWNGEDIGLEYVRVGLMGSPTKVLKVDYVVLGSTQTKDVEASRAGIAALVRELVSEYTL